MMYVKILRVGEHSENFWSGNRFYSNVDPDLSCGTRYIKGVLHPRLVFGLFLHFSQKLQHIGNK